MILWHRIGPWILFWCFTDAAHAFDSLWLEHVVSLDAREVPGLCARSVFSGYSGNRSLHLSEDMVSSGGTPSAENGMPADER